LEAADQEILTYEAELQALDEEAFELAGTIDT
jgi:hypothetical protein